MMFLLIYAFFFNCMLYPNIHIFVAIAWLENCTTTFREVRLSKDGCIWFSYYLECVAQVGLPFNVNWN